MSKISTSCGTIAILVTLTAPASISLADGANGHAHRASAETSSTPHASINAGKAGTADSSARTINISMNDNYYEPESVSVKAGETIRFVVQNNGDFVHEFNVGTSAMHTSHQSEMMMMVQHGVLRPNSINMEAAEAMQASMGHGMHDEPNSILLEPGQRGEVIWTFPASSDVEIEFACNVPGHYESGMLGHFSIN
ncbi:MAG: cupredoxin domain-containing protein [Alphaproteobacteria bacterium]|jgi:uncharacterized cupredoxin-like copper-binding protein|nr:cupredoxin domain-containing protein [Alphaproteobacteria bacterium]MBO6629268.1 cupredoxin domain-containing protein [Alphaproteobacteria bacterium]MDF1626693.1 cupredoxin domain-containing protein [Parvibaculaceae bacterium]|tara:strand:+ start:358 stop:942 length:585 start_codon:yes stop_codon:yes gene_type:complete